MKTVILIPYRPRSGNNTLWNWVWDWIQQNYSYPIHIADSDGPGFSRAQARNNAAKAAGDWDVAIIHDADTFAHPDAVEQSIEMAANSMQMVVTADAHMYCDRLSSQRIMASGKPEFARPLSFDEHGIYERPCSGVFAINRDLWDATGGYVESLNGWGYEDLVFLQQCGIFGAGNTWVAGHINLHLWHPPSPRNHNTDTNRQVWQELTGYRIRQDRDGARRYLATLGHTVP